MAEMSHDARRAALDRLTARFDAELDFLQAPQTVEKVWRVFAAKGRLRNPPKAGETF